MWHLAYAGPPTGAIAQAIDNDLGGYEEFKKSFTQAGATQFGSGWAWLVLDGGKLKVTKTPNAENPLHHGQTPLLTMDVWCAPSSQFLPADRFRLVLQN